MGSDAFEGAFFSIQHAEAHTENFYVQYRAFMDQQPYTKVVEFRFPNLDIHKLKLTKPLPLSLGAIAFDAVVHLRSALDHVGYAVAVAAGSKGKNSYFPFGDTAAEVLNRRAGGSSDLPQEIFDLMVSFQPQKGGDDTLWAMNKICNSHKHRCLTATAMCAGGGLIKHASFGSDLVRFSFPPKWDSAKNEMVLAVVKHGSQPNYDLEISAFVAFADVDTLANAFVAQVLERMAIRTREVVTAVQLKARELGLA